MRTAWGSLSAAIMVMVLLSHSPASADDHDRAREAVAAGRVLPLSAIVERAVARFGGSVLDAEYEDDDEADGGDRGRPAGSRYEIKLLTADGRILKLDYDAVTGELLGQRGRARERHRKGSGHEGDE